MKLGPVIRCCIYARVSTDEQAEKDLSIPFQLERCRYHAQGKGWVIVKEYVDAGESARTDKRHEFQKMIVAARSKEFDVILVHKFDRFARNDYDFVVYEKELAELGMTLDSVSEPGDASTPSGYIGRRMMQVISTWYSKNLAVEVKKGLQKSVENGGWPRMAPFGYLNKREGTVVWIEVHPKNGSFVTEAFKEMSTGNWTLEEWAEHAYSLGYRSRLGLRIARSKWSEIFHNRFYLGETWLKQGDIPTKGKHTPLVDEATFVQVYQVLRQHDKNRQRTQRHKYLLRGLVHSVEAGSPCSVETNNKKRLSYYRSRDKNNGSQVYYNSRTVEAQLPSVLQSIVISEETRQDLRQALTNTNALIFFVADGGDDAQLLFDLRTHGSRTLAVAPPQSVEHELVEKCARCGTVLRFVGGELRFRRTGYRNYIGRRVPASSSAIQDAPGTPLPFPSECGNGSARPFVSPGVVPATGSTCGWIAGCRISSVARQRVMNRRTGDHRKAIRPRLLCCHLVEPAWKQLREARIGTDRN